MEGKCRADKGNSMKPSDPAGRQGPAKNLPDDVQITEYVYFAVSRKENPSSIVFADQNNAGPRPRVSSRSDPTTRTPLSRLSPLPPLPLPRLRPPRLSTRWTVFRW